MGFGLERITTADTTPDTNSPAPTNEPMANDIPPLELPAAEREDITSGAPFPKARRVTPAKDSEKPSVDASFSNAGERYPSAVDPKI